MIPPDSAPAVMDDAPAAVLERHAPVSLEPLEVVELQAFLCELMLAAAPCTLEHFRRPIPVTNKKATTTVLEEMAKGQAA